MHRRIRMCAHMRTHGKSGEVDDPGLFMMHRNVVMKGGISWKTSRVAIDWLRNINDLKGRYHACMETPDKSNWKQVSRIPFS